MITQKQAEWAVNFDDELKALLKKYDAEITVATYQNGYETGIDGIEIDFGGDYHDPDCSNHRPFHSVMYPSVIRAS